MHETNRRRRAALIASSAPAAAMLIGVMVVTASASPGVGTLTPNTATATTRDVSVTLTADGVVESASDSSVVHGRSAAVPLDQSASGPASTGDGQTASAQPSSIGDENYSLEGDLDSDGIQLAAYAVGNVPTAVEVSTTGSTATPTATLPPTATAPPTTVPPTTAPPTTAPPTTVPPTSAPPTTPIPTRSPPTGTPPVGAAPGAARAGGFGGASAAADPRAGGTAPAVAVPPPTVAAEPVKTCTGMADLGRTVTTGTEVYAADGEPVVAVVGATPSWRTLKDGADDGSDVRTLERALKKLGFGKHLAVDNHFDADTAAAVTAWEKSLDRADPDGEVDPDEILLIASPGQVVEHTLAVGDPVPDGAQVLVLASATRVITVTVAAADIDAWTENATVTVRWADGDRLTGRVSVVSHDVSAEADGTNGTAEVTVVPGSGALKERTGTTADVDLVTRSRSDTVTVPVAALRDGPAGRPSVTVVKNGVSTVRSVEIGLVAQGFAEVTAGIQAGERVVLPGGRERAGT